MLLWSLGEESCSLKMIMKCIFHPFLALYLVHKAILITS